MHRKAGSVVLVGFFAVALLALLACGGGEKARRAEMAAQVESLKQAKAELDGLREELESLRGELTAEPAEAEDGEEAAPGEGPEARIAELEETVQAKSDELGGRLVDFLNAADLGENEPDELVKSVIRMKTSEDMLIAREYIEKGGDYRRAIEIYQMAQSLDPDNAELQAALDEAEAMRYMTAERFAAVQKGMHEDEVAAALGHVNLRNVREYPERKVTAWFYPKDPAKGGGAAGVFFRLGRDGKLAVYQTDFDAVKSQSSGG